jgi:anti-anti-sigma regulatory factor
MTEIKKSLNSDGATTTATITATLDFTRRRKWVTLRLEGTILSEHVAALRDFLRNLSSFAGTKWTLDPENLAVISVRGLRILAKFARVIQRRGFQVEVTSVRPAMYAMLCDMGMGELFNWESLKRQPRLSIGSSRRELPKMARKSEAFVETMRSR